MNDTTGRRPEREKNNMKKNAFIIERHAYAPEMNSVRYARTSAKLPGKWNALSSCKNYDECVRFIRAQLRKGMRGPDTPQHYAVVTFADSGNVYARGCFRDYSDLKKSSAERAAP